MRRRGINRTQNGSRGKPRVMRNSPTSNRNVNRPKIKSKGTIDVNFTREWGMLNNIHCCVKNPHGSCCQQACCGEGPDMACCMII